MIGLTEHESDLAASGAGQAKLITATISVTNFLLTHGQMPPLGREAVRWSFSMPDGDDARLDRLAAVAAWLGEEPVSRDGTLMAYRDFDGIFFGAHFTPRHVQKERAHRLLHGTGRAA